MRRTLLIAGFAAIAALSACSLYFSDAKKLGQEPPDGGIYPFDAGWDVDDAGECCNKMDPGIHDGGSGCGNDGGSQPDAGLPADGGCCPTDANLFPDAF